MKEGRRGLLQIHATYKAEIINTAEYLNRKYKEDQFVNILRATKTINQKKIQQLKQHQSLQKN
jgi:hypothetical protein